MGFYGGYTLVPKGQPSRGKVIVIAVALFTWSQVRNMLRLVRACVRACVCACVCVFVMIDGAAVVLKPGVSLNQQRSSRSEKVFL